MKATGWLTESINDLVWSTCFTNSAALWLGCTAAVIRIHRRFNFKAKSVSESLGGDLSSVFLFWLCSFGAGRCGASVVDMIGAKGRLVA